MKLTLLGTGSPEAHARRASSGYLVEVGNDRLLLDCGGGVYDRLLQAGHMPSDVTHLFFTHLHSDHMMDYARLVHAAWDEGGTPLKVWGPPPLAAITEKLFGRDGVFAHDLIARTEHPGSRDVWVARGGSLPRPWPAPQVTEIEPGFAMEGDGWRLSSCAVPHVQPWLASMAFRIESEVGSLVYAGDAGLCETLPELASGADLLLHWCYRHHPIADETLARLCPVAGEIARVAEAAGVRHLVLTHLRAHMDTQAIHAAMLRDARSVFSGTVEIGEDLRIFGFSPDGAVTREV